MEVFINGSLHPINDQCTLANLVKKLELQGKFAIEINQNIIPRSSYQNTTLKTGDHIEIVQAIGGG